MYLINYELSTGLVPALSSITINQEDDDETFLNELGPVVDMIIQELIGCWMKFEEKVIIEQVFKNSYRTQFP